MLYTNCTVTINGENSIIDKPVILYRGDKEIEIKFYIMQNEFYQNVVTKTTNVVSDVDASFSQLIVRIPEREPIFSEVTPVRTDGAIVFKFTAEMIDEITEVGSYDFQIRLLDEDKISRATIPPVIEGIKVKEPIAMEDEPIVTNDSNEVNVAQVNEAVITTATPLHAFDEQGNYIETTWTDKMLITDAKLNKIEDGITGVNQKADSVATRIPTKASQLENDSDYATITQVNQAINNASLGGTIDPITPVTYEWEVGGVTSAGELRDATNRIRVVDYITFSKKTTFQSNNPSYQIRWYKYDTNQTFITELGSWTTKAEFEASADYVYRIAIRKTDDATITTGVVSYFEIYTGTNGTDNKIEAFYNDYPTLFYPNKFKLEAHRGYSDKYPENTLLAFEEAGKRREYSGIETDVHRTSDGVFVLMHDSTIDRTTNGTGKPSAYTYAELQAFYIDGGNGWDAKYANQLKIPKLTEYLAICRKYGKIPYIQVDQIESSYLGELIELLDKEGWKGRCVLTSFTLSDLQAVRAITDEYIFEYMIPVSTADDPYNTAFNVLSSYKNVIFRPDVASFLGKSNAQDFIYKFREAGILLECYGLPVGNTALLNKMLEFGIEGATCNSYVGFSDILGITNNGTVNTASDITIVDTSNNFTATNVEGALAELFQFVSNGKTLIASAITDMGIDASNTDSFEAMANKIRTITTHTITYEWQVGGLKASGELNDTAKNRIRTTEYKTITGTTTFTASNGYQVWWYRYNASDHSFVDSAGAWATTYTLEPNDSYVYYIAIRRSDNGNIGVDEASNVTITVTNGGSNVLTPTWSTGNITSAGVDNDSDTSAMRTDHMAFDTNSYTYYITVSSDYEGIQNIKLYYYNSDGSFNSRKDYSASELTAGVPSQITFPTTSGTFRVKTDFGTTNTLENIKDRLIVTKVAK